MLLTVVYRLLCESHYHLLAPLCGFAPQKSKKPGPDVEARYSSQYEQSLDPFSSFSRQERARKYSQLSPFEKVTLSMVSMEDLWETLVC